MYNLKLNSILFRVGHSISTKTPDGKPAKMTFKLNAGEMGRIRQIVTNEYKYKKGVM